MIRAPRLRPIGLLLIAAALPLTALPARGLVATACAAPAAGSPWRSAAPGAVAGSTAPQAAAPKPPASSAQSEPAPPAPKNLELLDARDYTGILGKKIMGPDDKELGLVVDVLIDARGRPRAAIVDFGGFLGVGSRKIAVDWHLLQPIPGQPDWKISLNLGRAEIQGTPEYKPDAASNKMVGPPPQASPPPQTDR
jgi:PRC-barrel domain